MEQAAPPPVDPAAPQLGPDEQLSFLQFHSISTPRRVQELQKNKITSQYELHVLYYQTMGNKTNFKKRQIYIGHKNVKTVKDGDLCNSLTKKGMKTKGKKILLSSPNFDQNFYLQQGAFLNKKFWNYNLLWEDSCTPEQNFFDIQNKILNDPRLGKVVLPQGVIEKISVKKMKQFFNPVKKEL